MTMMKRITQLSISFILAYALFFSINVNAQPLNGNYTIGTTGNYPSIAAAVAALSTNGVNGPVTFSVQAGTYTGQINIGAISGTSATNVIVFDGGAGNASTRIIQHTATSNTDAHTLRFVGCNNITFRNLTIRGLSNSSAVGIHFFSQSTTNDIRIEKCSILVPLTSVTSVRPVLATNSTDASTGGGCSGSSGAVFNIYLDSNYIYGGNIGVFLSSSSNTGTTPHNFFVRWNRIEGAWSTGIGASGSNGYLYEGNYILMSTGNASSKGIHHCNGSSSGIQSYRLIGNMYQGRKDGDIRPSLNPVHMSQPQDRKYV